MSTTSSIKKLRPARVRLDLDLDARRVVSPEDVRMLPPTATPAVGDATVVCTLFGRVTASMRGVNVVRCVDGRRNVSSLTLKVSRNALGNLMDVDEALLVQARRDTDAWFARVASVDEFFRASTATDRGANGELSLVAKISLDVSSRASTRPAFSAQEGENIDIVLQLVGLRFLKQHVDVLWRFVSSTPSQGPFASVPIVSDDEEEDSLIVGPTPEERETMFTELFARIDVERAFTDGRLRELDALADALEDGHDAGDARILETACERLDTFTAAGQSCRQDTSCSP